ncbi:ribosome recycling factor domain-containing protein [Tribonema minus]|uniref:Ribosome recycling factor domain-containing protein n=1 Tax=Tribonema minus TaxID=303371 RepID=A0A836CN93_9STRA|nr:ribosome recycling factor domain-containing protein [Tribonema minus]
MQKSVDKCRENLATLRTGRASPGILDRVFVDYYGTPTPLKGLAAVKTSSATQLMVEPYDRSSLSAIERGILESGVGLNPNNDGQVIRLNIPAVTEDRRKELCKEARALGEEGKVAVRNIRRDVVEVIKKAEKSKEISQDQSKNTSGDIQKITDKYAKMVDEAVATKEKDIMTV